MITFKRGKRKLIADYKTEDFYRYYKEKYPTKAVDIKTFTSIWDEFIDLRMQLVIYNNLEFHMPHRFGSIIINSVGNVIKLRADGKLRTIPDWGESKKLWASLYPDKTAKEIKAIVDKPIVYYTNEHSNGKFVKIMWDKTSCNFKYHTHYAFKPVRKWTNKVSEYIKTTKTMHYYERVSYQKRGET
ncbi:MAG TPA: hypothetical protein PLG47_03390 [Candidatus Dojkabacteria bacterium]|nr:hypothetical protein [Candidatus Dojkabacteria bacterium]